MESAQKRLLLLTTGFSIDMACSRCGSDCSCACSGNPLPALDWRRQVSLQVRAHKARKRRRLDPDAPLFDFDEPAQPAIQEATPPAQDENPKWRWDQDIVLASPRSSAEIEEEEEEDTRQDELIAASRRVALEESPPEPQSAPFISSTRAQTSIEDTDPAFHRPPLPPFPRVTTPAPKIIEFPRVQRSYELAEPVSDQLRIFEADEELPLPPPSHLTEIEIAPQEPVQVGEIEVPLQAVPLATRAYATALDLILMTCAIGVFALCAQFFANAIPITKQLLASGAVSALLLLTLYYLLSFSFRRSTIGIDASGLRVITFSGHDPSRTRLRCRALATVLSYAALGMGFAWSFIDEDQLCWHDRITHTYLAAK